MKRNWIARPAAAMLVALLANVAQAADGGSIPARIEALLGQMTLDEKVGQLHQLSDKEFLTGPQIPARRNLHQDIRSGKVGSMLNVKGALDTRAVQALAMQSRLKIPLLFGLDVIHGYQTVFPVPLGEAASWDLEAIEQSARIAAREASSSGIHWTFAPMVDIGRDPRWGRVMEGAGEDTFLASRIAAARVRGFQGAKLGGTGSVMATAKHFAAYGAAIAGRDYNAVDMSGKSMRADGSITLSFTLVNTGPVAGAEVVQLYLRDPVASIVRPLQELKGFQKLTLQPGQQQRVNFTIGRDSLAFFNRKLEWTAEPGQFQLMVGAASNDIRLRETIELID
ncbi:MAG: Beta-glucosidase [Massilia sp.]|nr:Beta-glucosidase [Massilia sp.]